MPADSLRSLSNSALARFGIEVGDSRRDGWSLWPSEGGLAIEIHPTTNPIHVGCWGSWPENLDRGPWSAEPKRLSPSGTVFSAPPGETLRVPENRDLFVDTKYLILSASRLGSAPEVLSPRAVGRCGDWHVTEITIPGFPAPRAVEWLNRLGHGIAGPRIPIHFLTPPVRQRVDGAAVYSHGQDVLVHFPSLRGDGEVRVDIQVGTKNVTLRPGGAPGGSTLRVNAATVGEGIVRVRTDLSSGSALFSVIESIAEPDEEPTRLTVEAGDDDPPGCDPWSGRPVVLRVPPVTPFPVAIRAEDGVVPEIEIQRGSSRIRALPEETTSRDGAPTFVLDLAGQLGIVRIDCGPFGNVCLQLERGDLRTVPIPQAGTISPRDAWLRTIAPAFAQAGRPLPIGGQSLRRGARSGGLPAVRSREEQQR